MKDERGLYYHPNPADKSCRMYVRPTSTDEIEFRMFSSENPDIWEQHPWVPLDAIKQAARMYQGEDKADPLEVYDESVARLLLRDEK